jgi:hypothetical protein
MADRTLERTLGGAGSSYSELLDGQSKAHALEPLCTKASIDAVAKQLAYSDCDEFASAFRRWPARVS